MGRGRRIGLILAATAVAVVAFVLLRPDEAENPELGETVPEESRPGGGGAGTAPDEPEARPGPEFETIRISGGEVAGGMRTITVRRGERVRIRVESDTPDEIHLHGYDLTRRVAPDRPARFRFDAEIEGAFEIEAHDLGHLPIGRLVVEP